MAVHTIDLGRVVGPKGDPGELSPIDASPSSGSENAVSSGGVYTALQAKQDIPTGAASTVMSSNLAADKVVITNNSGKLVASSISSSALEGLANLGQVYEENLLEDIETSAQSTEILSLELDPGVYIVTGWFEIGKIVKDGRYGIQFYIGDETVTPAVTVQNLYQNPTNTSAAVGWTISYVFSPVETEEIHLRLLAPGNLNGTVVTVTRARIQALRIL